MTNAHEPTAPGATLRPGHPAEPLPGLDPDSSAFTITTHTRPGGGLAGFTVQLHPSADADHHLRDFVDGGTLAGFLSGVAHPTNPPNHQGNLWNHISGSARSAAVATHRAQVGALIARDRHAWPWRRIGEALGVEHTTAMRQVKAVRRDLATVGVWVDADGVHTSTGSPLSADERATVAAALAHHREGGGQTWAEPVVIRVPDRLVPGQVSTATASSRYPDGPVRRLVLTKPVTLDGGPHHEHTADVHPGQSVLYMPTDGTNPDTRGSQSKYTPTDDRSVWLYQGEVPA